MSSVSVCVVVDFSVCEGGVISVLVEVAVRDVMSFGSEESVALPL